MKARGAALGALLTVVLAACDAPPAPPLRVAVNPWVGYDPLVLARERGLADPAEVQVVELMSATESHRALRNGLVDAAALTLDEALRLADSGVPLRIVAVLDVSHGADAVLAQPSIDSPAALRGKRIALEEAAVGALLFERLLAAGGLRRDEVQTLHVEAAQHDSVLPGGRADAVVTYEPIRSQLLARGYRVIFDSSRMPGEIVDVLAVRAELPAARARALLAAWEAGQRALLAEPQAAAAILAPASGLSADAYLKTLDGLRLLTPADSAAKLAPPPGGGPAPLARDGAMLAQSLQALGLLAGPPDWPALLGPPRPGPRR